MKIYDCFTFNDELEILNIRLNTLDKFIDKFIIVESIINHQGQKKKINFDINLFKKFKNKINYFLIESFPKNSDSWQIENFQRNYIANGLKNCEENDVIIVSDADEIPKLNNINFKNLTKKIYSFEQSNFMYKLNLIRPNKWLGSKLCKYKHLKSPQWLRSLKTHKKHPFFRIDKIFKKNYTSDFEIVKDGGWHFSWLKSTDNIILKIKSYAHTEYNISLYKNKKYISGCIKNHVSFFDEQEKLQKEKIDKSFPDYIKNNKILLSKWIEK
jgi:beta-1,4-mannosyl-glycoprotein beta-1,4-N-acetylglucosaminyltransferase